MINLNKFIQNKEQYGLLSIKVVPNFSRIELIEEDGKIKVYLKSIPDKNKANQELVKFFKNIFGLKVEIFKGRKSRNKILKFY